MSLKGIINESYRALSARALRSTIKKYKEIYASNGGNGTRGGSVISWQRYYRGYRLLVAVLLSGREADGGNTTERVEKTLFSNTILILIN